MWTVHLKIARSRLALRQLAGAEYDCYAAPQVGAAFASPTDLVRVRLQGEAGRLGPDGRYTTGLRTGHRPSFGSTANAFATIARVEGLRQGTFMHAPSAPAACILGLNGLSAC